VIGVEQTRCGFAAGETRLTAVRTCKRAYAVIHALLNTVAADFSVHFGGPLPFVHELSSDSPCRAPVPLRIAIAGL
jgi:hypothetical protein